MWVKMQCLLLSVSVVVCVCVARISFHMVEHILDGCYPILFLQQIYNNTEKQYTYRDKYYGRSLDREAFIKTLKEFVYDGSSYRTDIIPTILRNLHQLKDLISKQNGYRFYSSSLLLLYDGDQTSTRSSSAASATSSTCVCMIDFAHTTCPLEGYQTDPIQYNGPDEGYVLGLNSLIEAFQSHLDQLQQHQ